MSWPACALAVSVGLGLFHAATAPALNWAFDVSTPVIQTGDRPKFETVFEYTSPVGTAHAPAIQMQPDGFAVFWFDGLRESHNEVIIKTADFTRNDAGGWDAAPAKKLFNKEQLAAVTHPPQKILTLGNTIQQGTTDNTFLATIVSVGGWAAASIAQVQMQGDDPAEVRKLSLSPFLNRSHLVRAPTVPYADGSVAIPAYLELGNALGDFVRVDDAGFVRDKRRMTHGRFAIQPMVVPFDADNAVALMRNFDDDTDRLIATWTKDGGRHWSAPELLDLPNPNAPVAAVSLGPQTLVMAYNETPSILHLAVSQDQGRTWDTVHTLEQGGGDVRYPAMALLPDGDVLLTYSTGSKKSIKAVVFNAAWVVQP
ncbi:hypothetical protein ASD8599_01591 [Ascidiaceihabitans donghaensis]|uniref:Sialidase domain-containing protein n=1 Tax=Ascidiaceihabitans donghaensis TaxID=1510460 RepID=A0A2R8BCR3_9RHOB|nr:sialidase family protein [Ascidiaceihabitans donghaensis]SPH20849.1 hypothetical protein ASD8599_01591 [Ascidiaceihabitans donghaensis]